MVSEQPASRHRHLLIGSIVVLLDGIGLGILLPLLPFVVLAFGSSPAVVTQLVAVYALSGFFGGLLLGELSDRLGRVRTLKLSLIGSALANIGILLTWSLPMLFLFRGLAGLMTGRDAAVRAHITDNATPSQNVQLLGTLAAASAIGAACGPALTGLLGLVVKEQAALYKLVFGAAALLSVMTFFLVRQNWQDQDVMPRAKPSDVKVRLMTLGMVWRPLMLGLACAYAYGVVLSTTALFGHYSFGWTVAETGWLLMLIAASIACARFYVLPRITQRWNVWYCFWGCLILGGIAALAAGTSTTPLIFVSASVVLSVTTASGIVLTSAMIAERAPAEFRGLLLGAGQAVAAGGWFVSAAINGILFEFLGHAAPYAAGAGALAFVIPVLMADMRSRKASTESA